MDSLKSYDDTFMKLFGVADKMRHDVLQTASKKNIALIESLTYRQHKAMVSVLLLTENNPIGVSLKKLAERMNMTVPATSVLVESMVKNEIFLRAISQTDRRAVCIRLSDFGKKLMDSLKQKMNDYIRNLYLEVSDEEKAIFSKVIRGFHEKLFAEEV